MKRVLWLVVLFALAGLVSPPAQLEIEQMINYIDGNWIVAGLITNEGSETVQFVSLELAGEDDSGRLVLTDTTYAFSPVPPGSTIPFHFINGRDRISGIKSYSVSVADYSRGGRGSFDFQFEQFRVTERNNTFHKYSSRITNTGDETRQFVEVAFMGFDSEGELVCIYTTYPNNSTLRAGATSIVDILVNPARSRLIENYRVIAYSGN